MADEGNDVATTATKRQHLNSSTGTLIPLPTLPFDLVVKILYRLPVKSLMQLQCVCKSWKSLFTDPKFAKNHLHISKNRHCIISSFTNASDEHILNVYPLSSVFTEITATPVQLQFSLNNQYWNLIIGSCHGILCFSLVQGPPLLWNPSIRKFAKLPSLKIPTPDGTRRIYGFGYDHVSHTYKVVSVNCYSSGSLDDLIYKTKVKVHTLGTDSWRRIQDFPYAPLLNSGKFVCGTINWLAYKDSSYTSFVILSLNLEKESYQKLLLPPDHRVVNFLLGVLKDCLCVFSNDRTSTDVWLMKEYGNNDSWTKLFHVPHIKDHLDSWSYARPLYVFEDDQVLLDMTSKLLVYNSRYGTFKDLGIPNTFSWFQSKVYQESLISPCS